MHVPSLCTTGCFPCGIPYTISSSTYDSSGILTIRGEKREENRAEEKDEGGRVVYLRTERAFGAWICLRTMTRHLDGRAT